MLNQDNYNCEYPKDFLQGLNIKSINLPLCEFKGKVDEFISRVYFILE